MADHVGLMASITFTLFPHTLLLSLIFTVQILPPPSRVVVLGVEQLGQTLGITWKTRISGPTGRTRAKHGN